MDKDYIVAFKDYKDHILVLSGFYQTVKNKDNQYHSWICPPQEYWVVLTLLEVLQIILFQVLW